MVVLLLVKMAVSVVLSIPAVLVIVWDIISVRICRYKFQCRKVNISRCEKKSFHVVYEIRLFWKILGAPVSGDAFAARERLWTRNKCIPTTTTTRRIIMYGRRTAGSKRRLKGRISPSATRKSVRRQKRVVACMQLRCNIIIL